MTSPATAIGGWFAPKAHRRVQAHAGWRCICCGEAAPWPLLTCGRFVCRARPKLWIIKCPAALRRILKGGSKLRA
jgi:hypothetical protein